MSQANKPMTDQEIEMMKTRYNEAFQQEQIAELEAENQRLRDANRWIPVRERLPTKTRQYWTTKKYDGVEVMVGQDLFIGEYNEFSTAAEVIAWREIQEFWNEPYQEDV